MTFEQFIEKAVKALEKHYGNEYHIKKLNVKKNNGIILCGISILPSGDETQVTPTIYLEEYYEKYESGVPLADLVREIALIYEKYKIKTDISMDFFTDYNKVRDRVVYKLINYRMNEELLREIPHIPFLDMAIVFYYYIENETFGTASILINDSHMKRWKVGLKELTQEAERNTPRLLGYHMCNMEDMMRELIRRDVREKCCGKKYESGDETLTDEITDKMVECLLDGREAAQMYVLSNNNSQYGAICMLYPGVLKKFAECVKSDLYILPSSIHEVIIITNQGIKDAGVLKNMVNDVNRTQLAPEEILSDEVYYYSRFDEKISICECKTGVK